MLLKLAAIAAAAVFTAPAFAQETIRIPNIIELSGGGAPVGQNWKNGTIMAVDEINAKGGILGKKIEMVFVDTASDPGKARAGVQRAIDDKPMAIFGPIYSGSVIVTLKMTNEAEIPQIMGGEAASLTAQGAKYVFRTAFGQNVSMPKLAEYMKAQSYRSIAVVYQNNEFGKGGRNAITPELEKRGIKVAADLSTEPGQADFAPDVARVKSVSADAVFVYLTEEESARFLIEAKKQAINKPLLGETTLLGQKVVDLAGGAAEGIKGHVGLTADADNPLVKAFDKKFEEKFKYRSDHNGMKGYMAPHMLKAAVEKAGKWEPKAIAAALHGLTIDPAREPGILLNGTWDANGDIDRESYLVEIKGGRQVIVQTLPKLKN